MNGFRGDDVLGVLVEYGCEVVIASTVVVAGVVFGPFRLAGGVFEPGPRDHDGGFRCVPVWDMACVVRHCSVLHGWAVDPYFALYESAECQGVVIAEPAS